MLLVLATVKPVSNSIPPTTDVINHQLVQVLPVDLEQAKLIKLITDKESMWVYLLRQLMLVVL